MLLSAIASAGITGLAIGSGDILWFAIVFFVLAVISGLLGMGGIAGLSMDVAKYLVLFFLVLAIVALLL